MPRLSDKTRDAIRSALFEAAFVVLGVILALGANEWRQTVADRDASERALQTILEEVRSNREAVTTSLEYHSNLVQLLFTPKEPGWVPVPGEVFPRGFVSPAQVSATAWKTASQTGVLPKTDYDVVIELSSLYATQDRYEEQSRSVGRIIYGAMFEGGTDAVAKNYRNLATIIGSFAYRERQLLESYDATIAYMEGR